MSEGTPLVVYFSIKMKKHTEIQPQGSILVCRFLGKCDQQENNRLNLFMPRFLAQSQTI